MLSLNQATVKSWTLAEAVAGCAEAGIQGIGLWRDRVQEVGLSTAARIVREAGLTVTSLCRGGFFTTAGWEADNRAAIEEAAGVAAGVLVLVAGGLPDGSKDLVAARAQVVDAIALLAPYARELGIRLALEPLHPMFCADRCVISTLGQALDIAEQFPVEQVGVVVDTYHVWWDPCLETQLARAGRSGRIACFQICDWLVPLPADVMLGRGHIGDGLIDIPRIARLISDAGFDGPTEVEIFNQQVWDAPGAETLRTVADRYQILSKSLARS